MDAAARLDGPILMTAGDLVEQTLFLPDAPDATHIVSLRNAHRITVNVRLRCRHKADRPT